MTISGFTAYVKQLWKNKPDTSTPLSADRLLHIEDGIKGNSDAIAKIAAAVVNQITNDPDKIASMAALYAVNQSVTKLNSDLGEVYGLGISIPAGADLNNYITPGNYYSFDTANTATLSHVPEGVTTGFRMEVKSTTANKWVKQIVYPNANLQRTHTRQSQGAADDWTGWARSITNADLQIVRVTAATKNGSNIVTATVPGLRPGKACVTAYNTNSSNYILNANCSVNNTLSVTFANNFATVGNVILSVVFEP